MCVELTDELSEIQQPASLQIPRLHSRLLTPSPPIHSLTDLYPILSSRSPQSLLILDGQLKKTSSQTTMEQCLQRSVNSHQPNIHANKWESAAMCVHGTNGNSSTVFDCSICLDNVQDPVVTLCGHLFCWACIYKWIHVGRLTHNDPEQQHQCPVCKAEVSENNLIPLYSGAQSVKPSDAEAKSLDPVIPRRPAGSPCGTRHFVAATALTGSRPTTQLHPSYPHRVQPYGDYLGDYTASMPTDLAGTRTTLPVSATRESDDV
ncbi:hypothetical protein Nepgr_014451 [Nepenthes gracilis]|uniref:E3 ubiquitin-protein ligase RMA n=1 Tax=Nepenthes gracilis TaxID=150966 RepID=A0AAD3SKT5_NEPGR|nr:hypothetical protein Nepgr_014451 [Nepenthes gracilis]